MSWLLLNMFDTYTSFDVYQHLSEQYFNIVKYQEKFKSWYLNSVSVDRWVEELCLLCYKIYILEKRA